ncbi:agmatinase [Desulfobotulus alkaliphilus]|uniref:Agmatinase n=1 Tax=Desulfobotulus alkaliphilus TaxID=622671 RepID=A0A562RIF5_9BACT|nr:agmatinase [Desulfobotulus alkaliphilus]TWI68116.1 agmatinase [Desulfobotulus alkaliphilus]
MENNNAYPFFMASENPGNNPDKCLFHVIPVPWEASVSYGGGTAMGPSAILKASDQLERFDGVDEPANLGIWTHPPVACESSPAKVLSRIAKACDSVFSRYGIPVLLGGEHTVTLGGLMAAKEVFGEIGIVQIDAHADLRDAYEGNPYSHASVMRRALDLGHSVFQVGVRALSSEEADFREAFPVAHLDASAIALSGIPNNLLPHDFPERIWLTIDVDGIDPTVMPATGTPVPGGLSWYQTLDVIAKSVSGRRIIGFDCVELAPIDGLHHSDFTAAHLIYQTMGMIQRQSRLP